ncbi:MAG: glycosyltransferase [Candidatus Roizmanbacteria bacterium]|nr:glycosyltransferase [Candidatus Roizmanbacteria bacterium]
MKPFFSIIIPTLNEEKFVGRVLTDIASQTFTDFEVVVVDGSSTDKTRFVAKSFSRFYKVNVLKVTKRNVSFQRNSGASKAKGSYLVFLDADSHIKKNFLNKLSIFIRKYKGLVFIPAIYSEKKDVQMQMMFDIINTTIKISQNLAKPFSSGGNMIVEKNFFHLIGGFAEDVFMSEDHQLIQTAYRFGVHARFLDSIQVAFSLRRMEREGKLKLLYKTVVNTIHFISNGKVEKHIIEYEMGGHLYHKQKNSPFTLEKILNMPVKQIQLLLKQLLSD